MKVADMTLREAKLADAEFVADLETAIRPDDPRDPVTLKDYWRNPDENSKIERFIGEIGSDRVAFAFQRHDLWKTPERYGSVSGDLMPSHRTAARIDALFAAMEERSRADGAKTLTTWCWEDDALRVGAVTKRGYREERRQRFWELDLVTNRTKLEAMAEAARAKMREIVVANLARTSAKITFDDGIPAMAPTDGNYAILKQLSQVSQDLGFGKVGTVDPADRGAGDIAYVSNLISGLDGLGADGAGAHAPGESVELDSMPMLTKRAAILIYRLSRQ